MQSTRIDAAPAENRSDPSSSDAAAQKDVFPAEQERQARYLPLPQTDATTATTPQPPPPPPIQTAENENQEQTSLSAAAAGGEPAEEKAIATRTMTAPTASVNHITVNKNTNPLSATTKKRKKRTPKPNSHAEDRSKPFVPVRDYYHSNSFIKFKDSEWEHNNDVDSDDEVDHSWRRRLETSVRFFSIVYFFMKDACGI